ncbi:MAG: extracellular solute-binding protein [Spirochaetia bacterium]|jgi:multiple sugar transport system substrate-binding protein
MKGTRIKKWVITMLVVGIVIGAPAVLSAAGPAAGNFDWKKYDGTTIHFLGCAGPYNNTIQEAIPLFKAKTGITVVANFLPETDFFNKVQLVAAAGAGEYDNYMVGFPNMIDWVPASWLEPLDGYIANPQVTNPDQNMGDFFPNVLRNVKWDGVKGHRFGSSDDMKLMGLPLGVMVNMLMYRKDIFQKYNLPVPTTIDEAIKVGKIIQQREPGMYGIATRGVKEIQQLFGGVWSTLESYGGTDFDSNMNPAFASDGMVKGLNDWSKMIKEIGNVNNWASMTWYDVMSDLSSGKAAMALDACAIGGWINSGKDSAAKGHIAFAEPFKGSDLSKARSFMWAWNIAVASGSRNKEAAWYFAQFVTSKDMQLRGSDMSWPTRKSVFDDKGFQKANAGQIDFFNAWAKTIKYSGFEFSPVPGLNDWGYQLAGEIQDVVLGRTPAEKAMKSLSDYYNKSF